MVVVTSEWRGSSYLSYEVPVVSIECEASSCWWDLDHEGLEVTRGDLDAAQQKHDDAARGGQR
jgi:hypothetical protein